MLSKEGLIYLFSIHMIHSPMQICYEYNYEGAINYSLELEHLVVWLLEEIIFPAQEEHLTYGDHLDIQTKGEQAGDQIFIDFNAYFKENSIKGHIAYCLWVLELLKHFDALVTEVKGTIYYQHYEDGKQLFMNLTDALEKYLEAVKINLDTSTYQSLEEKALNSGNRWLEAVKGKLSKY